MLTIKSDDVLGRSAAYDAIVRGEPSKAPNVPASFHVLINELKGLALDVELKGVVSAEEDLEAEKEKERGKIKSRERFEEFIEAD